MAKKKIPPKPKKATKTGKKKAVKVIKATIKPKVAKKEKLKKAEREKLRKFLLAEKERILEQLRKLQKLSATDGSFRTADELPHHSMHMAEFASESQAIDAALGLRNIGEEHLTQIEESLEKLERGEYGICEACGKPINLERLLALPFVKLCLECKKQIEQGGGI